MPPLRAPTIGMIMSLTRLETMLENEAPMITPTARPRTLPRARKVLNSLIMFCFSFSASVSAVLLPLGILKVLRLVNNYYNI